MMECSNCGLKYEQARVFCGKCRTRLSHPCGRCGFDNLPADRFCGRCGRGLDVVEPDADRQGLPAGEGHGSLLFFDRLLIDVQRDKAYAVRAATNLDRVGIAQVFAKGKD